MRACSNQNAVRMPFRRIARDVNEAARDVARVLAKTEAFEQSRRDRRRVEMLFAHLKRILRLARFRLRGPCGAQDEFTLAAIAQNLRRLAKLVIRPPPTVDRCLDNPAVTNRWSMPPCLIEPGERRPFQKIDEVTSRLRSPTSATKSAL